MFMMQKHEHCQDTTDYARVESCNNTLWLGIEHKDGKIWPTGLLMVLSTWPTRTGNRFMVHNLSSYNFYKAHIS
jgi:hypothetical protein